MQKDVDDNKRTVHFRGHAFLPFVAEFFFLVYRKLLVTHIHYFLKKNRKIESHLVVP